MNHCRRSTKLAKGVFMLRFVIKRTVHNEDIAYHSEGLKTVDMEIPELEKLLDSGGCGNGGYEQSQLVGVEILPASNNSFNLKTGKLECHCESCTGNGGGYCLFGGCANIPVSG